MDKDISMLVYPFSVFITAAWSINARGKQGTERARRSFPLRSNNGNSKIMGQLWFINKYWILCWWKVTGGVCLLFPSLETKPHCPEMVFPCRWVAGGKWEMLQVSFIKIAAMATFSYRTNFGLFAFIAFQWFVLCNVCLHPYKLYRLPCAVCSHRHCFNL